MSNISLSVVRFDNGTTLQLVTFEIEKQRTSIYATIVAYGRAEESMFIPCDVSKIAIEVYSANTAVPILTERYEITQIVSLTSDWIMPNEMALDNLPRVTYRVTAQKIDGGLLL